VNCERCGEHPATIRYTEVLEGEARKLRICEECAASLGFGPVAAESAGEPNEGDEPAIEGSPATEADTRRCPECGLRADELKTQSLLGCPLCYETFADRLDEVLLRVHGAARHEGRLPHGRTAAAPDAGTLQRDLDAAIARDDFQTAARLRDLLRRARRKAEP
jgi:protein arginine kinase activator